MPTVKLTVQRGKVQSKDVAVTAGTAEAQTDTISLNIDYTNARKGDIVLLIEALQQRVLGSRWPIV